MERELPLGVGGFFGWVEHERLGEFEAESPGGAFAAVLEQADPVPDSLGEVGAMLGKDGDVVVGGEQAAEPGDVGIVGGVALADGILEVLADEGAAALGVDHLTQERIDDRPGLVIGGVHGGTGAGGHGGEEGRRACRVGLVAQPRSPAPGEFSARGLHEHRDESLLGEEGSREIGERGEESE